MHEALLQFRDELEALKKDPTQPLTLLEKHFIDVMRDKMVLNYREVLSQYSVINAEVITSFDQHTILAFLTLVIRMDRFVEGTMAHYLRSGLVLIALERLICEYTA